MNIKKIKMENVRLFENIDLDFDDKNIIALIGENSSGKTTLLKLVNFFSSFIRDLNGFFFLSNFNAKFYEERFIAFQKKQLNMNNIKIFLENYKYYLKEELQKIYSANSFDLEKITRFQIFYSDKKSLSIELNKKEKFSLVFSEKDGDQITDRLIIDDLVDAIYQKNIFEMAPILNPIVFIFTQNNEKELMEKTNSLNLKILSWNKNKDDFKLFFNFINHNNSTESLNINDWLLNLFSRSKNEKSDEVNNFKSFLLEWIKIADVSIKDIEIIEQEYLINFVNNKGETLNLDQLSEGTRKWIVLFIFSIYNIILGEKNKEITLILIDEIENFLHRKLTLFFISMISDFFGKNLGQKTFLIYTTHLPLLLENINLNEFQNIYLLEKKDGERKNYLKLVKNDPDITYKYLEEELGTHPSDEAMERYLEKIDGKIF